MAQVLRSVGYTGYKQDITWASAYPNTVTAYLWGAGGGGGGGDGGYRGGNGTAGGYSSVTFTANPGDVISIAVGRYGAGGLGNRSSASGGSAGQSYVPDTIFSSKNISGTVSVTNRAWCAFLNTYGVWISGTPYTFDKTVSVNFPTSGTYTIVGSTDDVGTVYIDGTAVANISGYRTTQSTNVTVSAGTHSVRIVATNNGGGPAGVAVTINSAGTGYSGGAGGNAGGSGSSGAGGGGGGATVLLLNDAVIAVAGGGAGGGGAGYRGGSGTAPGPNGQSSSETNGQTGGTNPGDGGGGGGGGGGWRGGNGGYWGGGSSTSPGSYSDTFGQGGSYGLSLGSTTGNPTGTIPPQRSNTYYSGVAGIGGGGSTGDGSNGESGFAAFVFDISGTFVNDNGDWKPSQQTYIKDAGVWKPINGIYVKNNGSWQQVYSTSAPYFTNIAGDFGVASRTAPQYVPSAFVEY